MFSILKHWFEFSVFFGHRPSRSSRFLIVLGCGEVKLLISGQLHSLVSVYQFGSVIIIQPFDDYLQVVNNAALVADLLLLACSTSWLGFPVGSAFRFAEVLVSEVQACPAGLCRRDSPPFDLQPPLGGETLKVLVSGVVDASFLIIYFRL